MAERMNTAKASKTIGFGYSDILSSLLTQLDQPVQSSDGLRSLYKQMITEDETIGTALEYLTGHIVARIGSYSHENASIKKLVDDSIENVRGTMTDIRRAILRNSFAFGVGIGEMTIEPVEGQWLLGSVQIIDPVNIKFRMGKYQDGSYRIKSVVQDSGIGGEIDIPAEKCIIKTYGDNSTPYGKSLLRRCYRWWRFKNAIPKMWAKALERFGMPLLVGRVSSKGATDMLEEALDNINTRAYIVTDKETEITPIHTGTGSLGAGYIDAEELCDKMIFRSMFLPSLLNSGEKGGSYALGQVHMNIFNVTVDALAADYIDVELEHIWRPLIEWNFGEQTSYGSFTTNEAVSATDKKTMSEMILNLSEAGVVSASVDRAWMRELLGLPEIEEGAIFPEWRVLEQEDMLPKQRSSGQKSEQNSEEG